MGFERCKQCGVTKAVLWVAKPVGARLDGCARGEEPRHAGMCASMRIELLQMALRRAVMPEAFDNQGRIKEGWIVAVLDAERDAIRRAALTKGPMAVPAEDSRIGARR